MIQELINQIREIQREIPNPTRKILNENKKIILDYVRIDQLFELGEDGEGRKLIPYTPFTRAVKISEGRDPNIVTLFDQGDFYNSADLTLINEDVLNIFFTDPKTPDLLEKYGQSIDDLNDENEEKVNELIENELIQWLFSSIPI